MAHKGDLSTVIVNAFRAVGRNPGVFLDPARFETEMWQPTRAFGGHFRNTSGETLGEISAVSIDDAARRCGFQGFSRLADKTERQICQRPSCNRIGTFLV